MEQQNSKLIIEHQGKLTEKEKAANQIAELLKTHSQRGVIKLGFSKNLVQRVANGTFNVLPRKKRIDLSDKEPVIKMLLNQSLDISSNIHESVHSMLLRLFPGFKVSVSTLKNYIKNDMKYSYKRSKVIDTGRNIMSSILERHLWFHTELKARNIDYFNCVFIDEAAFNINQMKKKVWSKLGHTPISEVVYETGTKLKTVTCIGAISTAGLLCLAVKASKEISLKRQWENTVEKLDKKEYRDYLLYLKSVYGLNDTFEKFYECYLQQDKGSSNGTRRMHIFLFLWNLLCKLVETNKKGHNYKYIYLDNVRTHQGPSVGDFVCFFNQCFNTEFELCYGYRYSPDLNPIELFWKSMRDRFNTNIEFDNVVDRIFDAASKIPLSLIQKFIFHGERMLKQVIKCKPLIISKFENLTRTTIESSNYKYDKCFIHINELKTIFGDRSSKDIFENDPPKLVHIGNYGKGKRCYFVYNGEKYSIGHSKVKTRKKWLESPYYDVPEFQYSADVTEKSDIPKQPITVAFLDESKNHVYYYHDEKLKKSLFDDLVDTHLCEIMDFFLKQKLKESRVFDAEHSSKTDNNAEEEIPIQIPESVVEKEVDGLLNLISADESLSNPMEVVDITPNNLNDTEKEEQTQTPEQNETENVSFLNAISINDSFNNVTDRDIATAENLGIMEDTPITVVNNDPVTIKKTLKNKSSVSNKSQKRKRKPENDSEKPLKRKRGQEISTNDEIKIIKITKASKLRKLVFYIKNNDAQKSISYTKFSELHPLVLENYEKQTE